MVFSVRRLPAGERTVNRRIIIFEKFESCLRRQEYAGSVRIKAVSLECQQALRPADLEVRNLIAADTIKDKEMG